MGRGVEGVWMFTWQKCQITSTKMVHGYIHWAHDKQWTYKDFNGLRIFKEN